MRITFSLLLALLIVPALHAFPLTSEDFDNIIVGGAQVYKKEPLKRNLNITKIQVLMDRAGFSPGVIDGRDTKRFRTQMQDFFAEKQVSFDVNNEEEINVFLKENGGPAIIDYKIRAADLNYAFTPKVPELYIEQAAMKRINFKSPVEMFAERFHMDEDYLRFLNKDKKFNLVGEKIKIASVGTFLQKRVVRIEADKFKLQVRAYGEGGALIATYPASIGSSVTPSPSGTHSVRNKAKNPAYTYDPNGSAQPGLSQGLVLLPPGPNGPVGNAWIGLSKKTYGIHGTPEPSEIGLTASVGCVRLTNWDALELARLVRRGVRVTFVE